MIIWLGLIVWIFVDLIRYIRYRVAYNRLNGCKKIMPVVNHKNIGKLLDTFEKFPELLEPNIRDIYYQRVAVEDLCFADVCEGVHDVMCCSDPQYVGRIKRIVKKMQIRERNKNNRQIFTGTKYHHRIKHKDMMLRSWFNILPVFILTRCFHIMVHLYMLILGYQYTITSHGIKIWYTVYSEKRGKPLVFFHASVGGVSTQASLLKYYSSTHNIIMPEIPGVSFINTDVPPTVDQIVDDTYHFITEQYLSDQYDNGINLMGHSLGNNICCGFINKYPQMVDNFFCIEGQIFFNRSLRIYADFESHVKDLPKTDLITVPLFHRNLCVQYFMTKVISPDLCFIYDLTEETKHIKIHMFHVKGDNKIHIKPQLEYAVKKKIPLSYHLFGGDYWHGSFAYNSVIRKYVITKILEIYQQNKNLLVVSKNKINRTVQNGIFAEPTH
jgi:hypothetical protein